MGVLKFVPANEMQTREWFAAHISESKYDLLLSQGAFPDYVLADCEGKEYRVEVEYKSVNFIRHGHNPGGCDFVLCWIHNAQLTMPVLELSTGRWYESLQVNDCALSKEERPMSAKDISDVKKAQIRAVIKDGAYDEYGSFINCFAEDLKKRSEFVSYISPTRIALIDATDILTNRLKECGVKIE